MIPIPVHIHGRVEAIAYVDDADAPLILPMRWYLHTGGYAFTAGSRYMHRLIMRPNKGQQVDHVNHDKLMNTRDNLRIVTSSQNMMNQTRPGRTLGITWNKAKERWHARIRINYESKWLGGYVNKRDAIAARYAAVIAYWQSQSLPVPDAVRAVYEAALLVA